MEDLTDAALSCDPLIQKLCQGSVLQFLFKGMTEIAVCKKEFICGQAFHIDSASYIVQNGFQGSVGACQRIFRILLVRML